MAKYSVIVPVYKVEAVLPRCIDSILSQTEPDFELILIDDGSPDRSGEICDEYAQKDPRIKVIHQENGGVSRARNAGLDIAQGEYIIFVDSDDYIDNNFLEGVASSCADLIIGGYQIEGYSIAKPVVRKYEAHDFFEPSAFEIRSLFESGELNYACTKGFAASIIRKYNIRFDETLSLAEDTLFVVQYSFYCRSIQRIETIGYHYVKYSHATLTGGKLLSVQSIRKIEEANDKIYLVIKEYLEESAEEAISRRIFPLYRNILSECLSSNQCSWHFISYLFRQTWFRNALTHVDEFCSDESPKYRALLKAKSAFLFWLYIKQAQLRNYVRSKHR